MKPEKREKLNKESEDIINSLEEILSSLNRIEDKLSKMIGENNKRLNEDLNKDYYLTYDAFGKPVYMPYCTVVTAATSQVDGIKKDFKEG